MDPVIAFGLTASVLVMLAIEGMKRLWPDFTEKYATALAAGLSAGFVAFGMVARIYPGVQPLLEALVSALIVWGTATGFYHKAKTVGATWSYRKPVTRTQAQRE
jgi:hypothetical protein